MHPPTTRPQAAYGLGLAALVLLAACNHGSSAKSNAASTLSSGLVRFDSQQMYDYALTLSSTVSMGAAAGELDMTLRANLHVSTLAATKDVAAGVVPLHVVLTKVEISSRAAEADAFTALSRELQAGFVVELRDGQPEHILMAQPSSAFAASLARSIAAELALGPAQVAGKQRWEAPGSDATGVYVAEYQALDGPEHVRLRKLRYAPQAFGTVPGSSTDLSITPQVVASQGDARIVGGELRSLTYSETLATPLLDSGAARAETRISLELSRRHSPAAPPPSYAALRAGMADVIAGTPAASGADVAQLSRSKIGDFTFASATHKLLELNRGPALMLSGADAKNETSSDRTAREHRLAEFNRAFTALTAILQTDEAAVDKCVQTLRSDAEQANFLIDALAGARSERAQQALVGLTAEPGLSSNLKARAESSIITVESPTAATIATLLGWLKDPAHRINAIYGLGIQARHLREQGQAELAKRAAQPLGELLRGARSTTERVHLLRGVANSGDPALLVAVKPLLSDADGTVRGAALEALRLMDAPEVDGIVANSLRHETSYETLRAAVSAAKARKPSAALVAALSDTARGSEDSQTRYRATQLLASWLGQRPELREVLSQLAQHDQNEDVRDVAARALAPS